MSLLVVGLSHLSAPVATLERAVVSGDAQAKLLHDVHTSPGVMGALVLSTCNRVEVYAEVDSFHGGVAAICELLAQHTGLQVGELTGSAYVHYQDRAAQHLLAVTCGLESMVIGESQILGQVRRAMRFARQHGTLGRELSDLSRLALRAGKRAHAETGIDSAGQNLVTLGLDRAASDRDTDAAVGAGNSGEPPGLAGRRVLVVGAGAMSSLAVATSVRLGAASVNVANRTRANAERLADKYGARVIALSDLGDGISTADIVVTCTGALGHVVSAPMVARASESRRAAVGKPGSSGHQGGDGEVGDLVFLDLALPRDVDPAVAAIPGVRLIDLATIAAPSEPGKPGHGRVAALASDDDVVAVRRIVAQELSSFRKADRAASVAPTVVALRAKAATVVDAELARLEHRLGDLDARTRQEIAKSMGRIADKLLHGPTVRVKELAGSPGAESYETALAVLFGLDPDAVQSVGRPDDDMLAWPTQEELGVNYPPLRLGTRRSPMALAQSCGVADLLTARTGRAVQIIGMTTTGDTSREHLVQIGGTGVFVSALRESLLSGEIDFAVHSLKDLPTAPADGIILAAVPRRDDPRDALAARHGRKLADLPAAARIGTGSPRRAAQLLLMRSDIEPVPIRGNAGTRLAKIDTGEVDAVVLAYAGLARLDRLDIVSQAFETEEMLPAPGQGALAIECLSGRPDLVELLSCMDDEESRAATAAERSVLATLEAGCSAPVGAYAAGTEEVRLDAIVVAADGGAALRGSISGPVGQAERLGRELAADLLARGANRYIDVSSGHLSDGDDAK